jgi:choloylglycine hydrolase
LDIRKPRIRRQQVTVTPRNYPFRFRNGTILSNHYAMIGMATIANGYPLYYEATNEHGLSVAGLNFPGLAVYHPYTDGKKNVSPFEFISYLLCQCKTVQEARKTLENMNLWDQSFSKQLPLSPLHWIISDRNASLIAEPMAEGLRLYDAPLGLLTNNPPYPYHLYHLADYRNLSNGPGEDRLSGGKLRAYSNGMGAMGLPGDFSSASRFVKAAYLLENTAQKESSISQFFHILGAVAMPCGAVKMEDGACEVTCYTSCCDTERGIYYYTTYDNCRITGIDMGSRDLTGNALITFPLRKKPDIFMENQ